MSLKIYENQFETFFNQITELLGNTRGLETVGRQEVLAINKRLSQLIAKSWLPHDPEGAEFKQVLLRGDSEEIKNWLKNHDADLEGVYGVSIFIEVSWDTFVGTLRESTALGTLSNRSNVYTLPYPPRPVVVTDEQLERWVNDTNHTNEFPSDPYIPLTCC